MEENFPNAEANYKALEKLMVEPENKKCADCTGTVCLSFIYSFLLLFLFLFFFFFYLFFFRVCHLSPPIYQLLSTPSLCCIF